MQGKWPTYPAPLDIAPQQSPVSHSIENLLIKLIKAIKIKEIKTIKALGKNWPCELSYSNILRQIIKLDYRKSKTVERRAVSLFGPQQAPVYGISALAPALARRYFPVLAGGILHMTLPVDRGMLQASMVRFLKNLFSAPWMNPDGPMPSDQDLSHCANLYVCTLPDHALGTVWTKLQWCEANPIEASVIVMALLMLFGLAKKYGWEPNAYEPLLRQNGFGPPLAGIMSGLIEKSAQRQANDRKTMPKVAQALRLLTKPRIKPEAAKKAVHILREAQRDSTVFDEVFEEASKLRCEFAKLLDEKDADQPHPRLKEIAAELARELKIPRGPKTSAASIATETIVAKHLIKDRYTWNPVEEDFTDKLTITTRKVFGDNSFDPRPAFRRARRAAGLGKAKSEFVP